MRPALPTRVLLALILGLAMRVVDGGSFEPNVDLDEVRLPLGGVEWWTHTPADAPIDRVVT